VLEAKVGPAPQLLVSGHSHVPFAERVEGTLVINCGSVGRPADCDPRGSFALAEVGRGGDAHVEILRFTYPVDEVVEALARFDVPGVDGNEYLEGVKS
jgi:predicted phosphodiesterase